MEREGKQKQRGKGFKELNLISISHVRVLGFSHACPSICMIFKNRFLLLRKAKPLWWKTHPQFIYMIPHPSRNLYIDSYGVYLKAWYMMRLYNQRPSSIVVPLLLTFVPDWETTNLIFYIPKLLSTILSYLSLMVKIMYDCVS